jgi:hypothetical protein
MKHIIPALVVLGTVAVLSVTAFLLYPHLSVKDSAAALVPSAASDATSTAPLSTLGTFGYRCGDGSAFTMVPSNDRSTLVISPSANAERLPSVNVTRVKGTTTPIYSGGGILFSVHGNTVVVSTSSFHTECTANDAVPFDFSV